MGTVPSPPTFAAGEKVGVAAKLNQFSAAVAFWATPPQCYAYHSAAQTLTTATWTLINLTSEVYDIVQSGDSPSHDTSTNPARLYFRTAGKYELAAQMQFASNATGLRAAEVRLNSGGTHGGTLLTTAVSSPTSGGVTSVTLPTTVLDYNAGDYVELYGYQASGGNLATSVGQGMSFMRIRLVGP